MKSALAPHLRKGIAYRQGVSETVYESFVREVQNLAKELESMPDGRPSRDSDKEYYSSENPAPTVQPTNYENLTTNSDRPMMRNEPKFEVDLDGDTQMSDINSL
ncbi:hypothetical protein K3495_g11721 [Podosphaera aphanis]|nr:hypothetical protein K3495_g11721 [Podosphaera aphanis]